MKSISFKSLLLSLLFFIPAFSFAGEIFGTLKKDGKPLVKQEVKLVQNGTVVGTATTDEKGYYSVTIKPIGKCTLELTGYAGAAIDVFSTNNSSEYTLTLAKTGDKWELKKQ
ncbi:MAG: carboxypeptidase-like regulatory domain-containing protein [Bacteroidota bacterium]|nr:carboxypeptidase-like regulatory domain-containing protein [Bacteroidota bacterium]